MPRKSQREVKKSEKQLISMLKSNARLSAYALGKKLGCSRQKVWRMNKELEKNNIIWGYTTVINEKKRGNNYFILLIKRSGEKIDDELCRSLLKDTMADIIEVEDISVESFMCLYGSFDWLIAVTAPDVYAVKSFMYKFRTALSDYIDEVVMLETLTILKKNWIKNPSCVKNEEMISNLL